MLTARAFEYAKPEIVAACNDVAGYHFRGTGDPKAQGRYTDDTQMSVAVAEAILSGADWTPELLAECFVTAFVRDKRVGYARNFQAFLEQTKTGGQFLQTIRPDSDKSGAAMRAVPCGVFGSIAEVRERTTLQARVTHDTPDGIDAACAAALMSHYFLYDLGPKNEVGAFLEKHVPAHSWNTPWNAKVRFKGMDEYSRRCFRRDSARYHDGHFAGERRLHRRRRHRCDRCPWLRVRKL